MRFLFFSFFCIDWEKLRYWAWAALFNMVTMLLIMIAAYTAVGIIVRSVSVAFVVV